MIKILLLLLLSSCNFSLIPNIAEKTKVVVNFSSDGETKICSNKQHQKKSLYFRKISIAPPYSNIRIFNCDPLSPSIISTNENFEFAAPIDSMLQNEFDLYFRKNITGIELLSLDSSSASDFEMGLKIYKFCISEQNKIKLEATISIDSLTRSDFQAEKSKVLSIEYDFKKSKSVEENISLAFLELSKQISNWILQTELCLVK